MFIGDRTSVEIKSVFLGREIEKEFWDYCKEDPEFLAETVLKRPDVTGQEESEDQPLQRYNTPDWLCEEQLLKLCEFINLRSYLSPDFKILALNLYYVVALAKMGVNMKCVILLTDNKKQGVIAQKLYNIEVIYGDFLEWKDEKYMKKIDVLVGNYPYHTKADKSFEKTQPIWDRFVKQSFDTVRDGGYISAIHPSGWRGNGNSFEDAKVLRNYQIHYLEIHDESDGMKTFGATTRYDWYVAQKCQITKKTVVLDQNGKKTEVNLKNAVFIPNSHVDLVFSFLAKEGEEKVRILHSFSAYESRKPWVSKEQKGEFKHPIVYSTPVEAPTIWYSNTKDNGHFGESKLILNPSRPIGYVVDLDGKYGMSQFCVGIVGDKKYLQIVEKVIKNQKTNGFSEFMEACHFTDKIFNKDVISLFRSDFWNYFAEKT